MIKSAATTLVALALLVSAKTGLCEEKAQPSEGRSWYGMQILLADTLSCATILGSIGSESAPGVILGLGGYFVGSPVIHGFHKRNHVVTSVLLRLALPLTGYGISSSRTDCSDSEDERFCRLAGGLIGFGIGMIAATVIDSALAWESTKAPEPVPSPISAPSKAQGFVSLSSVGVVPTANGASLMIGGQF